MTGGQSARSACKVKLVVKSGSRTECKPWKSMQRHAYNIQFCIEAWNIRTCSFVSVCARAEEAFGVRVRKSWPEWRPRRRGNKQDVQRGKPDRGGKFRLSGYSVCWWLLFSIDCEWNLCLKKNYFFIQTWRCLRSINLYGMRLKSLRFATEFSMCGVSKPYSYVSEIHKYDWFKRSVHPNNNKGTFSHSSRLSKLWGVCLRLEESAELTAFWGNWTATVSSKKTKVALMAAIITSHGNESVWWKVWKYLQNKKQSSKFGVPMQDRKKRKKKSLSTHE